MMFLQFAIWGAWMPVLATRLLGPLKFNGKQAGSIPSNPGLQGSVLRTLKKRFPSNGFALVVTVALMVLLALLAVGLLSLSTTSLRSSSRSLAKAEAEANARLALTLAIAQLQSLAGPDQRVTAPATVAFEEADSMLPPGRKQWSGVWRSSPDRASRFDRGRPEDFAGWLVSGGDALTLEAALQDARDDATVGRLPDGTQSDAPRIATPGGRLAWWTADEAQKAPLDLPAANPADDGERLVALHAPARPTPEVNAGFEALDTSPEVARKIVTTNQAALAAAQVPDDLRAHFTADTRAVVSDVRHGGLKRDLSTLFELPADHVPGEYGDWTGRSSFSDRDVYLYGDPAVALGARWNHLHAFYNLYKDVDRIGGIPYIEPHSGLIDWHLADRYVDFGDEAGGFRFPRIAKVIYVFSYTASPTTGDRRRLGLGVDIFVTLWNPFDTGILFPLDTTFYAKFSKGLPFMFQWYLNDVAQGSRTNLQQIASGGNLFVQSKFLNPGHGRLFHMAPGETLVFSIKGSSIVPGAGKRPDFRPGIHYQEGITNYGLLGAAGDLTGDPGDRVSVSLEPTDDVSAYTIAGVPTSQYIDFWIYDAARHRPFYEHRGELIAERETRFTRDMPTIDRNEVRSVSLGEVTGRRQPFAAFIMETRTAGDSRAPVPAFLFSGNARLSSRLDSNLENLAYERLEYRLEPVSGWDSDLIQATLPGDPAGPHHGYIGSGRIPATGRTHVTSHSIPAIPPISLATLRHAGIGDGAATLRATHWGFNSTPNPLYADSAVGNSYAHPLLPSSVAESRKDYDHCFLANELLWDSWFFSSLAPRRYPWFSSEQTLADAWSDFLAGEGSLLNPRMRAYPGRESAAEITRRLFPRSELKPDAHREIAAYLMLDGPFNVNSTSIEAWAAFLASTRGQTIERLSKTGRGSQRVEASGTLFSRTERVLDGPVGESMELDSHYAGYRDLDDEQILLLAEEVVAEVKTRGPFLSVSEFVNRRLSRDPETSLSGTLQTAIDRSGLNNKVAAAARPGLRAPMGARVRNADAATLSTAAGAPGWLMQGDILDPLGPFITVRGDTFRIRTCGESLAADGSVAARAWCEAVVQRTPDWLDTRDAKTLWPPDQPANQRFGRRFEIVSFCWLSGPDT